MKIPFNKSPQTGHELGYIQQALSNKTMSGDGYFNRKCQDWFEENLDCHKALMTPSCTAALEMAAILIDIQPGDEVIMPSYTFVSTANAFVLRGATIVFVDIRPDTMNIDEKLIEVAITPRTKAIVPVHYAGVACEMDTIMDIADRHDLYVIEDAAQGMMATYKNMPLGSIGHIGCYSFHDTKNYSAGGEGGLLIINDERFTERAEIIREKGTNRSQFFRGMVDKYSWVDIGSSYLMSEIQAAYLFAQLEKAEAINNSRLAIWNFYKNELQNLEDNDLLVLPNIPVKCSHNAHMFYIKVKDLKQRAELIKYLTGEGVATAFHYVPLHTSSAGRKHGTFSGRDNFTTSQSEKILRLPFYSQLDSISLCYIVARLKTFLHLDTSEKKNNRLYINR